MEQRIKDVFEEVLNTKLVQLSDIRSTHIDSLDLINVLFKLEEKAGIKISNDDMAKHKLQVPENLYKYLQNQFLKK